MALEPSNAPVKPFPNQRTITRTGDGFSVTVDLQMDRFPLNKLLYSLQREYRRQAENFIADRTRGQVENEDFRVTVDGRPTGLAGIRSAKLFGRYQGIQVRRAAKGGGKRMQEATRAALNHLQNYKFMDSTGELQSKLEIRINGRVVSGPNDPRMAQARVVEIYSKARHAAAVEKLLDGRLFFAAAKKADAVPSIFAVASYGKPNDYGQTQPATRYATKLAVPVIRITFEGGDLNQGRRASAGTYLPKYRNGKRVRR